MTEDGSTLPMPDDDGVLGHILDEYFKLPDPRPSVDEYAGRFPEHAEQIRQVLPFLAMAGSVTTAAMGLPDRIGTHRIVRELGRGGMGIVYEAIQEPVGRRVALKTLPVQAGLDPSFLERFRLEAWAAANLDHPHIVPVHQVSEADNIHYYTMALVDGVGLDKLLEDAREIWGSDESADLEGSSVAILTEHAEDRRGYARRIAQLGRDVAEALAYSHGRGVLHRDLKPSNLLLDHDGKIWVTDFGLCKEEESDGLTRTGDVVGTLRYLAPECFDGFFDVRSDIYALGVTLYELLTLQSPFAASTHAEIVHRIQSHEPPRVSRVQPDVPRDLEAIVMKAMHRDRSARYATADALAHDLAAFIEGRPVVAKAPNAIYLLRLWVRRHKAVATTVALALLTVAALTGVYIRGLHLARESERSHRLRAEWKSYLNSIRTAQSGLEAGFGELARRALEDVPPELRAWEWEHYDARLRRKRRSLPAPRGLAHVQHSRCGRWVAIVVAQRVEVRNASFEPVWTLKGHRSWVRKPSFDARGQRLVTFSADGTARIWSMENGKTIRILRGHESGIRAASFSPDGLQVVTGSRDFTVRLWDAWTGECLKIFDDHESAVLDVDFDPTGRWIVSGGEDGSVRLWDPVSGESSSLRNHSAATTAVAFSPGGEFLATGGRDAEIRVWSRRDWRLRNRLVAHRGPVYGLDFDPSGERLLSLAADHTVRIWRIPEGTPVESLVGHAGKVVDLSVAADGRSLLTAVGVPPTLDEWDLHSRGAIRELTGALNRTNSVAASPDGRRVATSGRDHLVRVWDPRTGLEVATLDGFQRTARNLTFGPQSDRIYASGDEGRVLAWDLNTGESTSLAELDSQTFIALSRDGATLAARSRDGDFVVVDLATGAEPRSWSESGGANVSMVFLDDRRIAATQRQRIEVIDVRTQERSELLGQSGNIRDLAVSADGSLLASISSDGSTWLWDTVSLENRGRLQAADPGSAVAFHPDGTRLVTSHAEATASPTRGLGRGYLKVWALPSGQELTALFHEAAALEFSPDGRFLVAGPRIISNEVIPGPEVEASLKRRERLRPLVTTLFEALEEESAVLERIRTQVSDPRDQEAALAVARTRKGEMGPYLRQSREVLLDPHRSQSEYEMAALRPRDVIYAKEWSDQRTEAFRLAILAALRQGNLKRAGALLETGLAARAQNEFPRGAMDLALLAFFHGEQHEDEEASRVHEQLEALLDRGGPDARIDPRFLAEIRARFSVAD